MEALSPFAKPLLVLSLLLAFAFSVESFSSVQDSDPGAYRRPGARPDIPLTASRGRPVLDLAYSKEPQQVHISLDGPNRIKVTWITTDFSVPSTVEFGTSSRSYTQVATGDSETYSYAGYKSGLIHHVVLGSPSSPLLDSTTYYYRCGGFGSEFSLKTPPPVGPNTPLTLALIGDLGQTGWSVTTLDHVKQEEHDAVIFAGDLSYADRFQPRWDSWGRLVQPLTSNRPWMTVHGNHELEDILLLEPTRFKAYDARWPMPSRASGSPSNEFYSFDMGPAHFVMLGSYSDYSGQSEQYRWLQADLAAVDRSRTPWLITVLHAPWYNSNYAHQREGEGMRRDMEKLLLQYRVDMLFSGHVHAYERSLRVADNALSSCGIHHVTVGDGGNREGLAIGYFDPPPSWSAFREASFGHGELQILNATTAKWMWHRNQDDVSVVADVAIVRSLGDGHITCSAGEKDELLESGIVVE